VSPFVAGRAVKGPTEAFMEHSGRELSAAGIAATYAGLIDGIVCDEPGAGIPVPTLTIDTLMADSDGRRRVAEATLAHSANVNR
jgi:LPPG:FO 2-phospho-L-lactate transferase